jgi:hypothetical protein
MDKIEKYKSQSIRYLILLVILGIILIVMIMWIESLDHQSLVLMAAAFLMTYVNYVNLKTKVEILQELKKKQL